MANNDNLTPERELLKLIEEDSAHARPKIPQVTRKASSFVSIAGLRARISFFRARLKKSFSKEGINLAIVNRMLAGIVVFLFVYTIADVVFSAVKVKENIEAAFIMERQPRAVTIAEAASLKEDSFYLDKVKKRDIFNLVTKKKTVVQQTEAAPKINEAIEKTKNFKLVGISWSDDPDIMIEDGLSKKTFFLKRGDMINDVRIEAIYKEKVVLSYKGQEVELK